MRGYTEFRGVSTRLEWDDRNGAFACAAALHAFQAGTEADVEIASVVTPANDGAAQATAPARRRAHGRFDMRRAGPTFDLTTLSS